MGPEGGVGPVRGGRIPPEIKHKNTRALVTSCLYNLSAVDYSHCFKIFVQVRLNVYIA